MRIFAIGIFLIGSVAFGAPNQPVKEKKWSLMNGNVDNFSMIPPKKEGEKFAPAAMIFDLSGKSGSVAVSLCGPDLIVESGADVSNEILGSLSVEKLDGLGWFSRASQVIDGKVILRVNTKGEKELLEKEIQEFREKHSCSYL